MRPTNWIALSVAATLMACSQGAEPNAEPADAPPQAAMPPGRDTTYAAARQGPEAFVRALYAMYGAPMTPAPPPGQEPLYSRMLNARIGADAARPGGATLDHDPICDCQTVENLVLDSVALASNTPQSAKAAVVFTNAGERKSLILDLVKEGPMWKIEDVSARDRPPLSQSVMEGLG